MACYFCSLSTSSLPLWCLFLHSLCIDSFFKNEAAALVNIASNLYVVLVPLCEEKIWIG